jgi:phage gpG-like protein
MRVRFVYRRGVEDEILRERGVADEVERGADRVATAAKGYAPVRTGRYRSSIAVHREEGKSVVAASVPYAGFVEWGTEDTPERHPLARAVETVSRSS